ncbi:MAG: DNA double-strand break repair nuclease NurA [uncultured Rubrobacteraceae bacterium]|uniref:DNA double-strand break repair nuclease NurA n=1 Tax=uncultured Rubrobacteraceae bacterium TaxID=349277 RepID=A0A6J4QE41_9ACTN|nr:MAG: DNA double-strand break repair nuclease NurA [uncultured Rubrobacteraceae bacterium]
MLAGSASEDFVSKISRALDDAGRRGIHVTAGAGTVDLEAQQFAHRPVEDEEDGAPQGRPFHLEEPPGPREIGRDDGTSKLCYFLDGVQSSREIGRIGMSPVIVATVAAAIINRCNRRFSRMPLEEPPVVVQAVILPRSAGETSVEAFWELLIEAGFSPFGPEDVPSSPHLIMDSAEYMADADPSDYVGMRERARVRVRALRERLEGEMLRQWELDDKTLEEPDAWIAVDGQLKDIRESNRRAIGLIKSVARPEFVGKDVGMLLDLEPGMRTTSFVPDWQLRRDHSERRTSWYLRMWPPQRGADALGSLMRVEAPRDTEPVQIDEISRWIIAERAPLAKPDPRWPAMIYPIRYVEKILKPLVQGSERAYSRLERQLLASDGGN